MRSASVGVAPKDVWRFISRTKNRLCLHFAPTSEGLIYAIYLPMKQTITANKTLTLNLNIRVPALAIYVACYEPRLQNVNIVPIRDR